MDVKSLRPQICSCPATHILPQPPSFCPPPPQPEPDVAPTFPSPSPIAAGRLRLQQGRARRAGVRLWQDGLAGQAATAPAGARAPGARLLAVQGGAQPAGGRARPPGARVRTPTPTRHLHAPSLCPLRFLPPRLYTSNAPPRRHTPRPSGARLPFIIVGSHISNPPGHPFSSWA